MLRVFSVSVVGCSNRSYLHCKQHQWIWEHKENISFVEKDLYHLNLLFCYLSGILSLSLHSRRLSLTVLAHVYIHQVWGYTSLSPSLPPPISRELKPMQPLLEISVSLGTSYLGLHWACFFPLCASRPGKSIPTHPWCHRTKQQSIALTTLGQLYLGF